MTGFIRLVLAVLAAACAATAAAAPAPADVQPSGSGMYKMYLWSFSPSHKYELEKHLKDGDPLRAVWSTWAQYHHTRDLPLALRNVDAIVRHWNVASTAKVTYGYAYNNMPAGWWSGMDGLMLPWLLVQLGQEGGRRDLVDLGRKVLKKSLASPLEGGTLWREGNRCWFSEYAWPGMKKSEEFYVLNGHLFSLGAVFELARLLKDKEAASAYECGMRGMRERLPEFLGAGDHWARYMTTPSTINPSLYLIYEIVQLDSLHAMTGESVFFDEGVRRRALLQRQYPIYAVEKNGRKEIFFSSSGAPHPYQLDPYQRVVRCRGPGGAVSLATFPARDGFDKSAFLSAPVRDFDLTCELYARAGSSEILIYSTSDFVKAGAAAPQPLRYETRDVMLDAVPQKDGSILLQPDIVSAPNGPQYLNTSGRVSLAFRSRPLSPTDLVVLEVEASEPLNYSISLNAAGKTIMRYGKPLKQGRQLVVLSSLGFDEGMHFHAMDGITFYFDTTRLGKQARVKVANLYVVDQHGLYLVHKSTGIPMLSEDPASLVKM